MFESRSLSRFAIDALSLVLLVSYGVFLIGYFVFPDYSEHYRVFIRSAGIFGLFIVLGALRDIWRDRVFQFTLVYMAYILASAAWSEPRTAYEFGQKLTIAILIVFFFAATHFLRLRYPQGFHRVLQFAVLFAGVWALYSLVVWYSDQPFPVERLEGIGTLTNANEFSNVYGVFALLAIYFAMRASSPWAKVLFLLPVVACVNFMWFAQSRTTLVAFLAALFVITMTVNKQDRLKIAGVVVGGIVAAIVAFPEVVDGALFRGSSFRLWIWTEALKDIAQAPFFGHGILSLMDYRNEVLNIELAHNAYIQVLWNGGVIGLGLFLILLGMLFRQARHAGRQTGDLLLLSLFIYAAICMLTAVDVLIARPRDQWLLFWFPLALLISQRVARCRAFVSDARA